MPSGGRVSFGSGSRESGSNGQSFDGQIGGRSIVLVHNGTFFPFTQVHMQSAITWLEEKAIVSEKPTTSKVKIAAATRIALAPI